jgi:hypothetical protein
MSYTERVTCVVSGGMNYTERVTYVVSGGMSSGMSMWLNQKAAFLLQRFSFVFSQSQTAFDHWHLRLL